LDGLFAKNHSRLPQCLCCFFSVTPFATAYHVRPARTSSLAPGDHVIKSRLLGAELDSTVLTLELITSKNIGSAKRWLATSNFDVAQQPDNSWSLYRYGDRTYFPLVLLYDLNLTEKKQANGSLPGNNPERLVAGI
jgi:hypothetical protein